MKLVVGLGNPGPEYRDTRHNVGFMVIDQLAQRFGVASWNEKFGALEAKTGVGEDRAILAKPLTFMNLSGNAVAGFAGFYKIEPPDVFVVVDDVALPLGKLRARKGGSAGGHNGLKSVIQQLGTQEFPRLRIGVGRPTGPAGLSNFVTSRFEAGEREIVSAAVLRAADATEMFLREGIERAMSAFNAAEQQDPEPAE